MLNRHPAWIERECPGALSLETSLLGAPKFYKRKMHGKNIFHGLKILKIHESKNERKPCRNEKIQELTQIRRLK